MSGDVSRRAPIFLTQTMVSGLVNQTTLSDVKVGHGGPPSRRPRCRTPPPLGTSASALGRLTVRIRIGGEGFGSAEAAGYRNSCQISQNADDFGSAATDPMPGTRSETACRALDATSVVPSWRELGETRGGEKRMRG